MTFDKAKVDALRKQYPPGTRIKLEHMNRIRSSREPAEPFGSSMTLARLEWNGTTDVR